MYVRKFEGDTLDGTLKMIKQDLGPDAIILKTVTNKGIKGAFKKKKFEITAAISEKSYVKKAQVDEVLTPDQKGQFYDAPSEYISNMIDSHTESQSKQVVNPGGYGQLGLNKAPQTTLNKSTDIKKSQLDDFLKIEDGPSEKDKSSDLDHFLDKEIKEVVLEKKEEVIPPSAIIRESQASSDDLLKLVDENHHLKERMSELEAKVKDVLQVTSNLKFNAPKGINSLRNNLLSLNISENYVQDLIVRISNEKTQEELEDNNIVFDWALKDMAKYIKTQIPLFSSRDTEETPVVTVLASDSSAGQTSMALKLGSLIENSVVIQLNNGHKSRDDKFDFLTKILKISVVEVESIAQIVAETRKALEKNSSVVIDYRNASKDLEESKKFIDGIKRSFPLVEVLITLSAIHSERYNKKIINKFRQLSDGVVISHLDLCLDYGLLFNLAISSENLPFKFFGTGTTIPDDIEGATVERLLSGIFQL